MPPFPTTAVTHESQVPQRNNSPSCRTYRRQTSNTPFPKPSRLPHPLLTHGTTGDYLQDRYPVFPESSHPTAPPLDRSILLSAAMRGAPPCGPYLLKYGVESCCSSGVLLPGVSCSVSQVAPCVVGGG